MEDWKHIEDDAERIAREVERSEFGELEMLSNSELIQFIQDAYSHIAETYHEVGEVRFDIELALQLLEKRGIRRRDWNK